MFSIHHGNDQLRPERIRPCSLRAALETRSRLAKRRPVFDRPKNESALILAPKKIQSTPKRAIRHWRRSAYRATEH